MYLKMKLPEITDSVYSLIHILKELTLAYLKAIEPK